MKRNVKGNEKKWDEKVKRENKKEYEECKKKK